MLFRVGWVGTSLRFAGVNGRVFPSRTRHSHGTWGNDGVWTTIAVARYSTSEPLTGTPSTSQEQSLSGDKSDPLHGSRHWGFERLLSVATLGLVGAAAVHPHTLVDFGLGIVVPLHCHLGFGAVITDYLPVRRSPILNRLSWGALYAATGLVLFGLYRYNTEDVGITEGVKTIWRARERKQN